MATSQNDWRLQQDVQDFRVYRRGVDLKIVLTRAKKGIVLTTRMIQALTGLYHKTANDKTVFRILLTAEGKYFCTGMDLGAEGGVLDEDQEAKQRQWHLLQDLFEAIDTSPKVTLALVNGSAFGAGNGLAFACDIRIAAENATFNVSEAKVGLAPAVIMKWVFREWGVARGREAMLTARPVQTSELESAGVVHVVVKDAAELDVATEKYIKYLDSCGPEALTAIKKIAREPEDRRDAMIKSVYDEMMRPSQEARHGVESFHAKKAPDWRAFYSGSGSKL